MNQLSKEFQEYANSFSFGFLKAWKANSIILMLKQAPDIFDDEVRFLDYLKSSLGMEGFMERDIELIMGWLYERKQEIAS
jgi:hypothetical protein